MSASVAVAATAATRFAGGYADIGGTIGATVSGLFLYLVGFLNLVILVGIMRLWSAMRRGDYEPEHLDQLLMERGLMRRVFRGRSTKGFDSAWQMYPVGVLFGLGFDTASEVASWGSPRPPPRAPSAARCRRWRSSPCRSSSRPGCG